MDKDSRVAIEEGIGNGDSCRAIASLIGVSPSTVTREVRSNRTVTERARGDGAKLSVRCARYRECERVGRACRGCKSSFVRCRDCRTRSCIDSCPDFELRMCPVTQGWPYVCPRPCPKRSHCTFPKVRYRAEEAQASYEARLSSSRSGFDLTEEQLALVNAVVSPLVHQGHSFEAICASHPELGVCARTLYNYQSAGILETSDIELPRKARVRPRRRKKRREGGRPRVDRTGREYSDFLALPVVDNEQRTVGIVTIDDAIDVIQEEATEDIEKMAAVLPSDKPYMKTGVFGIYAKRVPWLLVLMLSATFTSTIISSFDNVLQRIIILSSFIPMITGSGGNAGSQASVSVIRALSLGEIEFKSIFKVLWKEFRVAVLCGLTLAVANFIKLLVFDLRGYEGTGAPMLIALAVSLTIWGTIVMAKIVGSSLPLLAKKIGFDPAVMANPLISTVCDSLSLLIYFAVATLIIPQLTQI